MHIANTPSYAIYIHIIINLSIGSYHNQLESGFALKIVVLVVKIVRLFIIDTNSSARFKVGLYKRDTVERSVYNIGVSLANCAESNDVYSDVDSEWISRSADGNVRVFNLFVSELDTILYEDNVCIIGMLSADR